MPARVSTEHTAFARKLRREMTRAETMLWGSLRGGALDGLKFRRQVPIGRYVVDFLCVDLRLAVELDGAPHDREEQKAHDAARDEWLRGHGYRVLRLRNELVIGGGNIPLDMIRAAIRESPKQG
jgi:very-short-patch-repair endonuclease